ncbi:unnamed protein product [Adineta ricciae]|uniref:PKD/REJ-like domain-containing protein n=1 Tax=Adineta ricciae TaxID=249248 RepID=A0A815GQ51_ADIRI|nr:unnamed protein product [Adineta ricciae]
MWYTCHLVFSLILLFIGNAVVDSFFNQLTFCPNATWDPNSITFANNINDLFGLFVDINNIIYATSQRSNTIYIWSENSSNLIHTLSGNLNSPGAVFVANNGDIYVDNGMSGQLLKWTSNGSQSELVTNVNAQALGIFIDLNNTLYISFDTLHKVMKMSLSNGSSPLGIVAGTGSVGSDAYLLNHPNGIFIDSEFSLYVADAFNNRIQKFAVGERNGTTVAGNGTSGSFQLTMPTGVFVDGGGYLFIVDTSNNRIIGSGLYGFRCIVGCSAAAGSASNQLNGPRTLGFDSYGNIFVSDRSNQRIQKFILMTNSCGEFSFLIVPYYLCRPFCFSAAIETTTTQGATVKQTTITSGLLQSSPLSSISYNLSTVSLSVINQSNSVCFPPMVTLIPSVSTFLSPLQFQYSKDIYISSNIQLSCNQSLAIQTQWTVFSCSRSCSSLVQISPTIVTTHSDLFIPAKSLPNGIYEFKLTVTLVSSSSLIGLSSAYIQIIPTGITVNLFQFGTSSITFSYTTDLLLDPGANSIDPDENIFNASNWMYEYYCRTLDSVSFPSINGSLLTIDDPRSLLFNSSCFFNRSNTGVVSFLPSSLRILSRSLRPNQTYQFMVKMLSIYNTSSPAVGYLLVQTVAYNTQFVAVGCVISTMCAPNLEFQLINPTTQVALFSLCVDNCQTSVNITWNIYYSPANRSSNLISWIRWNETNAYENIWLFGMNTSNFTVAKEIFFANSQIIYWRFEVIYSSLNGTGVSALNFLLNAPPRNGSCSINPLNGTTMTLFTITCSNWLDENNINDYSLFSYNQNESNANLVAFSSVPMFQVRLPAGSNTTSRVNLFVKIQDTLNSYTDFNLPPVLVVPDTTILSDFIDSFRNGTNIPTNQHFSQLLSTGDQNTVEQIITILSQELNQINTEQLQNAVTKDIPVASVSVSSLGESSFSSNYVLPNASTMLDFNKQLNTYAAIREYLMTTLTNLPIISTANGITLQASTISQLTQSTNQLTRLLSTNVSAKCHQLAQKLYSIMTKISYEDTQAAVQSIATCVSNVMTAINGPLQQRITTLDLDLFRANEFPYDYDTDVEFKWSELKLFADGDDYSWQTIQNGRNFYYQKQTADQINVQSTETHSLLTKILQAHINIGQNCTINTSALFLSLETISVASLSNKLVQLTENAQVHLPSSLTKINSTTISIRSLIQPLAITDQSNTNLSRSLSFSIFDRNGNELTIQTNQSIKLIIPRDKNFVLPPMSLQNVTSINSTARNLLFNWHYINLNQLKPNLSVSLHLEMEPLNTSLAYLLVYKFDSSSNTIAGSTLFCPYNLTNDGYYIYFLDNQQTANHQSVIFGLREMNSFELITFCSNRSNKTLSVPTDPFVFSSNYNLRTYVSGCYYLDSKNNWQSDGLIVGSRTNHNETECYSNHLTTFAGGFLVLPAPINWDYSFSNTDFLRNKTVYIAIVYVFTICIILLIYLPLMMVIDNQKDTILKLKVQFIRVGKKNQTEIRSFIQSYHKIFEHSGVDSFLIVVSRSFYPLNCIHIWHDNIEIGNLTSWFFEYITFKQWIAVTEDNERIKQISKTANEEQTHQFPRLRTKQGYHHLPEGYHRFSIMLHSSSKEFTRIQRCTLCLTVHFVLALLNVLYHNQMEQINIKKNTNSLGTLGDSLDISSEQISVNVIIQLMLSFRRMQTSRNTNESLIADFFSIDISHLITRNCFLHILH